MTSFLMYGSYQTEFQAIRVYRNELVPTYYDLKFNYIPLEKSEDVNHFRAMERLEYFFNFVLSDVIICTKDNGWINETFTKGGASLVSNSIMVIPTSITDEVLAQVLTSKAQVLANDALDIYRLELNVDGDNQGIIFEVDGSAHDLLPNMKDWMGERTYHPQPWWARRDGSVCDLTPDPDGEIGEPPQSFDMSFIDRSYDDMEPKDPEEVVEQKKVPHRSRKLKVISTDEG